MEENANELFGHDTLEHEKEYLEYALIKPIKRAAEATYQNELERWAHQEEDAFESIDDRLGNSKFLLGDEISEADKELYKILLRHDHIYYYLSKLNFAKATDYPNLKRYIERLSGIEKIRNSIDIVKEKEQAFLELEDERNPYHLIFRGPETI